MTLAAPQNPTVRPSGTLRKMGAADVPAVGRLFRKIFRGVDSETGGDLAAFLRELLFGSPSYDPSTGSLVFEQPDGSISSAFLAIPMSFVACDRVVRGRLLCAFMTDSAVTLGGAGAMSLTMRAKNQHFAFSDTASPLTMKHVRAWGGISVPLQNLDWVRTFRPIGGLLNRLSRRVFRSKGRGLAWAARPLDDLLRLRLRRIAAPVATGLRVEMMTPESFVDQAPGLVARYAVRPLWSREELTWLLAMARQNEALGSLSIMAVMDQSNQLIGCFVFYADGKRSAHVLNVLAAKGNETKVLGAMFHEFDRIGFLEARGRVQLALMEGLALQPLMTFRHEAFVWVVSRYPEVLDAVRRGDVYLGGLAGERWSRLMSDFP